MGKNKSGNNIGFNGQSQFAVDEVVEHVVGCMWFFARYHMTCCVDNVVNQIIFVFCDPSFQRVVGIVEGCFGGGDFPSDVFDVLFGLEGRDHCVDIARVEHHFESCFFEEGEKGNGGGPPGVFLPDEVAAGSPVGFVNVELFLDFRIVEKPDYAGVIGVAVGLVVVCVVCIPFFEEGSVFVASPVFFIDVLFDVVANSDRIVGVYSVGDLGKGMSTSSANLRPMRQEGFLSSEASYLQVFTRLWISGPK